MREFMNLFETATIKITDLYDERDLEDDDEAIAHSAYDLDRDYSVQTMSAQEAKRLKTMRGDMTVLQAFTKFADREQKMIVKDKANNYDHSRIVVLDGDRVIDGNHHILAAIKTGNSFQYINLAY